MRRRPADAREVAGTVTVMEIDRLFGLPAHPLIVHAPLVLIPLVAGLALALALRPVWLGRFGIPLALGCIVLSVLCILATGSGEKLESHLAESDLIERHAELGEQLRNIVFLFTALVIGFVGYDRVQRRGRALPAIGMTMLAVLVGASAIGATVWDIRAGHAGAKASWSDTPTGTRPAGGEEGDG